MLADKQKYACKGKREELMVQLYAVGADQAQNGMEPIYVIADGKLYRTVNHNQGWSADPDYEMHADGCLYRTRHHPRGTSGKPDYEFRQDRLIYRTRHHPDGDLDQPVFAVYD